MILNISAMTWIKTDLNPIEDERALRKLRKAFTPDGWLIHYTTRPSVSLWFRLSSPKKVAQIGFANGNQLATSAKKFHLIASHGGSAHDDCGDMNIVLTIENANFQGSKQDKFWTIPKDKTALYLCYGLRFEPNGHKDTNIRVRNIKMWVVS